MPESSIHVHVHEPCSITLNQTHSCSAPGLVCICSSISLIAGSLRMPWTSGSAMALCLTSSASSLLILDRAAIIHLVICSLASCFREINKIIICYCQTWYFILPPCPLKCSNRNLQFPSRVPFTKEKMPWCPCPFINDAYRPVLPLHLKFCIAFSLALCILWKKRSINTVIIINCAQFVFRE